MEGEKEGLGTDVIRASSLPEGPTIVNSANVILVAVQSND